MKREINSPTETHDYISSPFGEQENISANQAKHRQLFNLRFYRKARVYMKRLSVLGFEMGPVRSNSIKVKRSFTGLFDDLKLFMQQSFKALRSFFYSDNRFYKRTKVRSVSSKINQTPK